MHHHETPRHSSRRILHIAAAAAILAACGAANAQPVCSLDWSEQFALAGTTAQISDTVVWDDGTGPALYAVGVFANRQIGRIDSITGNNGIETTISGAFNVAKWDGRNWNIVGSPIVLENDPIFSLARINAIQAFDPDGPGPLNEMLIVAGAPNGSAPNKHTTLQFDGTTWSYFGTPLSTLSSEEVRDLEVFNGQLYACGRISNTGFAGIARWDTNGQFWDSVGDGITTTAANIRAERMAVGDADGNGTPELYVSGTFNNAGGVSANRLAKWDGTTWSNVPGFTNTSTAVQANIGGPTVLKFMDIGDGPALLVGDAIYTGLTSPANTRGVALARLKNGVWSTLIPQTGTSANLVKSYIYAAEMFQGPSGQQVHIGGTRLLNGITGQPTGVSLARRNASGTFEPLGTFPATPATNTATIAWMRAVDWDFAGPGASKLVFGSTNYRYGTLGTLSNLELQNMAIWNGSSIEIAHSGSSALALTAGVIKELDPDGAGPLPNSIYIGHYSDVVAGVRRTSGVLTFDGTSYQDTPAGPKDVVAMQVFAPAAGTSALYVAGAPDGGDPSIAMLNGAAWTTVGSTFTDGNETQPATFDAIEVATVAGEPSLVVSGRFSSVSGVNSRWVARYNGTNWVAMDAGLPVPSGDPTQIFRTNTFATRVVNLNGQLFINVASSYFDTVSSTEIVQPSQFYRWNGTAWENLGAAPGTLYVLNTNAGTKLFAVKNFQPIGSDNSFIAEWNGTAFVQTGPGFQFANPGATASAINALGTHDFGSGPQLVAVLASAATTGTDTVSGLVRLDGTQWRQIPGGEYTRSVSTICSSSTPGLAGLYIGGGFKAVGSDSNNANGVESQGIARLTGGCYCRADFNLSGAVTADDIFAYLDAWFAQNGSTGPNFSADFNADETVNADDIFAFLDAWFAPC